MAEILTLPKTIWTPTARQNEMFRRGENEGFYGGAAGGGKSDYLVIDALRDVRIPTYKGLILRKTFPQLVEIEEKCFRYYPRVVPGAKYNAGKHVWTFPGGAKIFLGSMQHSKDKYKYQGHEYDFIGIDELTHFTYEEYSYLLSRNRPSGEGTHVRMRATGNPGGIGHGWVKQYFVTAAPPGATKWRKFEVLMPDGTVQKIWLSSVFVPSKVFDNPHLLEKDPLYMAKLANRGEAEKNALLYGSWDSYEGQVFVEWKDDIEHYRDGKWSHVINPFKIPPNWQIIRSFDWGYAKPFSVGWWAVDADGRYFRIRELYGCTGTPNTGVKWSPQQIAERIREIENTDENLKDRFIYGVADPAIFSEEPGHNIAGDMAACGVYWNKANNSRLSGKMQFHYRFAFDKQGTAMIYIFSTCKEFIRTIPNLVYSEKKVEDVDTETEDHIYDESRYALQEHVIGKRENALPVPVAYDPLDISNPSKGEYGFYAS